MVPPRRQILRRRRGQASGPVTKIGGELAPAGMADGAGAMAKNRKGKTVANMNRQTENRDAKRRRRRLEVRRTIARWEAENQDRTARGETPLELTRKIRALRKQMRVNG